MIRPYHYKVNLETGCWEWIGCRYHNGYGMIGGPRRAHRVMWEQVNGSIPEGLLVLHTCDVRHCVNPEHLWLGTKKDNFEDAKRKGKLIGLDNWYGEMGQYSGKQPFNGGRLQLPRKVDQ